MGGPIEPGSTSRLDLHCYGKLPFHAEYLRIMLDVEGAAEVVRWIDETHAALSTAPSRATSPPTAEESAASIHSFALPLVAETAIAVGVVARSSDGLREHPICIFAILRSPEDVGRWSLLPLACRVLWSRLAEILATGATSREEFAAQLSGGVDVLPPDRTEQELLVEMQAEHAGGAWASLVGATEEDAQHCAMNLLTICEAQREARTLDEGVALAIPLAKPDRTEPTAIWLSLIAELTTTAPGPETRSAIVVGGPGPRLFVFLRPCDGRDLASVLVRSTEAPIDELLDRWQRPPDSGSPRHDAIASMTATGVRTFANLLESARTAMESWRSGSAER